MKVQGGKRIYGYPIGILMLEAQFPRIPGDMGNALTFPFPVLYRVVEKASPHRVVRAPDAELLQPFIAAARELAGAGVRAITTNCGFLIQFQREMAAAVEVPVFTSSLLQVPMAARMVGPRKSVGIITIDSRSLTPRHMEQAGITQEMPVHVVGLEGQGHFTEMILTDQFELDPEICAMEHEAVANCLVQEHPDVGAIVLECTNMPPYAHRIQAVTGRPIFDVVTLTRWVHSALVQQPYSGRL